MTQSSDRAARRASISENTTTQNSGVGVAVRYLEHRGEHVPQREATATVSSAFDALAAGRRNATVSFERSFSSAPFPLPKTLPYYLNK